MEIVERKGQTNVSKITKWILCIINSDNWFYCFGKLLWQSATKCLTWFKFQNTFVSKLLGAIFLINEVDLIWISNAQRGKEEQKQKEDARKRIRKRESALRVILYCSQTGTYLSNNIQLPSEHLQQIKVVLSLSVNITW